MPRRGASHTFYATVSFLIFDLASFSVILDSWVSLTRSSGHTVLQHSTTVARVDRLTAVATREGISSRPDRPAVLSKQTSFLLRRLLPVNFEAPISWSFTTLAMETWETAHDEGALPAPYNRLARARAALHATWIGQPTPVADAAKSPPCFVARHSPAEKPPSPVPSSSVSGVHLESSPSSATYHCPTRKGGLEHLAPLTPAFCLFGFCVVLHWSPDLED